MVQTRLLHILLKTMIMVQTRLLHIILLDHFKKKEQIHKMTTTFCQRCDFFQSLQLK